MLTVDLDSWRGLRIVPAGAWRCDVAGKAAAWDSAAPRGVFLLLQFQSVSLIMAWEAMEDGPCIGTCAPTWETQIKLLAPDFSLALSWPLWPSGE